MHLTLEFGSVLSPIPNLQSRVPLFRAIQYIPYRRDCYAHSLILLANPRCSGGLELLCQSVKTHHVEVHPKAGEDKLRMRDLLSWVRFNLIKERPEMFMKGDTVRPGVLVLINDCDWELCGNLDAELEEKDGVVFISTLHGG